MDFLHAGLEDEVSPDLKLQIYSKMVLTRIFDAQCVGLQRQGRIGFYVPSEGEEAAEVGSALALEASDWIFPDYRASGVLITRGMPLTTLLAQLMGSGEDVLKGRAMPAHWGSRAFNVVPPSSPICTQLPHAVGVALGAKMRGEKIVTIGYFGDGGTSSNDFHSAMNFASVFKTPTVFFCRNNGYAISVPVSRQTATKSLVAKAGAYAMKGVRVDGNDPVEVFVATKRAIEMAREGEGPTLIEAVTYRRGPHTTSDDPTKYRSADESGEFLDPIQRYREALIREGLWGDSREAELLQVSKETVKNAITAAERVPLVDVRSIVDDVYSEPTANLRAQRELLSREAGMV